MLAAAVSTSLCETLYRMKYFESFFSYSALHVLVPIYLLEGLCFFWGFRKAPTFIGAWAWFIFFIAGFRFVVNATLGEPMNLIIMFGVLFVAFGIYRSAQERETIVNMAITSLSVVFTCFLFVTEGADLFSISFKPWMVLVVSGAATIAVYECICRGRVFSRYFSLATQLYFLPLIILSHAFLFYGYRYAEPTFLFAWGIYSVTDVLFRIANTYFLREPFRTPHITGLLAVTSGVLLIIFGSNL
jgi:hypothetical protein